LPFFFAPRKTVNKKLSKSKILIIFCNVLKINILFSNSRFLARFLRQMYIYIGFNMIVYFCRVSGAKKRIFAPCKILQFCNDDTGWGPTPATTDQRPTVTPQDFSVFNLFSSYYDIGFSRVKTYSVPFL